MGVDAGESNREMIGDPVIDAEHHPACGEVVALSQVSIIQRNKIPKTGDPYPPPVFPSRLKYRLRLDDRLFRFPVHDSFSLSWGRHRRNVRTETGRSILDVVHPLCKV